MLVTTQTPFHTAVTESDAFGRMIGDAAPLTLSKTTLTGTAEGFPTEMVWPRIAPSSIVRGSFALVAVTLRIVKISVEGLYESAPSIVKASTFETRPGPEPVSTESTITVPSTVALTLRGSLRIDVAIFQCVVKYDLFDLKKVKICDTKLRCEFTKD